MNTQSSKNYKPSDVHASPELLKIKATQANARRKERLDQKKCDENIKRREETRAKRAAEEAPKEEPKETPKTEFSSKLGKKIRVWADGDEFNSLNEALRSLEPVVWGVENDYRRSCWTKINRALKTKGEIIHMNHTFKNI